MCTLLFFLMIATWIFCQLPLSSSVSLHMKISEYEVLIERFTEVNRDAIAVGDGGAAVQRCPLMMSIYSLYS